MGGGGGVVGGLSRNLVKQYQRKYLDIVLFIICLYLKGMIKKHIALKYFVILGIMASKSFALHFDKNHLMIQNIDLFYLF